MSAAAEHLLAAIIGGSCEPEMIEVRPEAARSEFFPVGVALHRIVGRAIERSIQRETWIGMAPRKPYMVDGRQRGGNDAVSRGWVLSADCDTDTALDALEFFVPEPTFVLKSGSLADSGRPKLHAHWALRKPVRRQLLPGAKKRIAGVLCSDPKICDAARVMRLPGMVNHKPGEPVVCESVVDRPELVYTAEEVLANTPELVTSAQRAHRKPTETVEHSRDATLPQKQELIPPPEYVRHLAGIDVRPDGKACCPFHNDTRPSLMAYPSATRGKGGGWYCFTCEVGGDIYTFAGLLLGIPRSELYGSNFARVWRHLRTFYGLPTEVAV